MRKAMATSILLSVLWLVGMCAYAQSIQQNLQQLRDSLNSHLITAEGKMQLVEDHERRLTVLEKDHEQDTPRLIRLETTLDFTKSLTEGLILPIFMLALSEAIKLMKRPAKVV